MATANNALAAQVLQQLRASKLLAPTPAWLAAFLQAQRPGLPTNTLVQTASFRLLNSDIKTCLDPGATPTFPAGVVNATSKEKRLTGSFIAQVLDIEDMSRSRWSQIEEIEAEERGETTKGREIIRLAPTENDDQQETPTDAASRNSHGPHKLLLEDIHGTKIYAIELTKVDGVSLGMGIGSKMVLKDPIVARGVILLESSPKVIVLGGKIEQLHTRWRTGRKEQLRAAMQAAAPEDAAT